MYVKGKSSHRFLPLQSSGRLKPQLKCPPELSPWQNAPQRRKNTVISPRDGVNLVKNVVNQFFVPYLAAERGRIRQNTAKHGISDDMIGMLTHSCYFIRRLRFLFGLDRKILRRVPQGGSINLLNCVRIRIPRICLTAGISRENGLNFHAQSLRTSRLYLDTAPPFMV